LSCLKGIKVFDNLNILSKLFFILLALLLYCSENPFSDDHLEYSDGTRLRGKVILSDGSTPDQVYVWMKELNFGTYTTESGEFNLILPSANAQPGGGYNDTCNVYFYNGNYQFERVQIILLDGKIQLNQKTVDSKGNLKNSIHLNKLLSIRTVAEPDSVNQSNGGWIKLQVYLLPLVDSVLIQTFKHQRDANMFTNVYFKDVSKSNDEAVFWRASLLFRTYAIKKSETWYLNVNNDSLKLAPGTYDVIPYIKIIQDHFPNEMLQSIGENPHNYDTSYLNIPFKEDTGQLIIRPVSAHHN